MSGRTWKNQSQQSLKHINSQLLAIGGSKTDTTNEHELWRVRIADSVFIAFKSGTLYHTPSNSNSPEVLAACQKIDATTGTGYFAPSRDYLMGLDETGKGEIAGPIVLTGVVFQKDLFEDFVALVGPADTKKQHPIEYWEKIYEELNLFRGDGFNFLTETISPKLIDAYNVNQLLDLFYQKIISHLLKSIAHSGSRIVLDDYGAGKNLREMATNEGSEVLILTKAEDQFIEAKVASLISKKIRESILDNINQVPDYKIGNLSIGNGNISNRQTKQWLSTWNATEKPWPWFIKQSFKTIRNFEGQSDKVKKISPMLRTELLPPDFIRSFHGANSMTLSAIKCSNCTKFQQTILFDFKQIICPTCSRPIKDLKLTLRYYCGSLIVHPKVVEERTLIKDLRNSAFFEDYNVIIPWESSRQNPQFIEGLKELKNNESLGRFSLEYFNLDADSEVINVQIIKKAVETNSTVIISSPWHLKDKSPDVISSDDSNLVDLAIGKKVLTCIIR